MTSGSISGSESGPGLPVSGASDRDGRDELSVDDGFSDANDNT